MKIAVTYENGQIFQHFGRTLRFKFYEVEDGKIVKSEVVGTDGQGHGALVGFLKENGVDTVICGGLGAPMANALVASGIALYAGNAGSADDAVAALLAGKLGENHDASCDCHGEH